MPTRRRPSRPSKPNRPKRADLQLADLANVGPATLGDFAVLGISSVRQLARRDPLRLYHSLCQRTGTRHDPCVIDVFMATIHQARGGRATPWWKFTPERKALVERLTPGQSQSRLYEPRA